MAHVLCFAASAGSWDVESAPEMQKMDDTWEIDIPGGLSGVSFKLAIVWEGAYDRWVEWEEGPNRTMSANGGVALLVYGKPRETTVLAPGSATLQADDAASHDSSQRLPTRTCPKVTALPRPPELHAR